MKNYTKKSLKASNGITLIALVITIIVLLILAGISISMLSGDNGILQQTTNARTRTIHANVIEQMQLEASAYTVDKSTGKYSDSLIDYLKSKSIISDISGEEDKWLINVTTLLGSNQSMGSGTYPNDVYVLEKQDTSTGSIVNTKVASTMPIRIAATTNQVTYKVVYYENTTIENLILGKLVDTNEYPNDVIVNYGLQTKNGKKVFVTVDDVEYEYIEDKEKYYDEDDEWIGPEFYCLYDNYRNIYRCYGGDNPLDGGVYNENGEPMPM